MITGRRAARTALTLGLAGFATAALLPATAQAGVSPGMAVVNSKACPDPNNKRSAEAVFTAPGDKYIVRDVCNDGHSAQIQVDVGPLTGGNHYDWKVTETGGWGAEKVFRHNEPEGRDIAIRACVSNGSQAVNCGPWKFGET